jgi:hypothetical protein
MRSQNLAHYPSLEELDTIENYIYSLAADQVDLTDTVIAVFAYQYREASRTSHLRHADFVYSRTGVARIGTAEPQYNSSRRSFWAIPDDGGDAIVGIKYERSGYDVDEFILFAVRMPRRHCSRFNHGNIYKDRTNHPMAASSAVIV